MNVYSATVGGIDSEPYDLVLGIVLQVVMGYLSDFAGAEDDHVWHGALRFSDWWCTKRLSNVLLREGQERQDRGDAVADRASWETGRSEAVPEGFLRFAQPARSFFGESRRRYEDGYD